MIQCIFIKTHCHDFCHNQQTFGEKPQLISTVYKYDKSPTFYHEFKGNPQFSMQSGQGINHLSISDMNCSDSATYYFGSAHSNLLGIWTIVYVKGTDLRKLFKYSVIFSQSVSESTLNCKIHTETCAGEHSVYWFRHGSGESHPGIIYTHGDSSDQCEKSPEAGSPTQSCVYNLLKRNLTLSDAGTYYGAVASCGEILLGNRTKLDVECGHSDPQMKILVLFSIIKTGVLLFCLTIFINIYLTRKYIKLRPMSVEFRLFLQ
uniref:Immunoglobulin V-set domain-containing protein n=1 Tax=Hucho hucho TaxID=62062 RepID=A0A4W5RTW1_9TELE